MRPQVEVGAFKEIQPPSSSTTTSVGYKSLMSPDPLVDQTAINPSLDQFTDATKVADTVRGTPILDKFDEGAEWFGDKVSGIKETTVGRGADYALKGYGAYSAFAPGEDIEEPFYNANIGLANAGLTQVDQNNQLLSELQFSPVSTGQDASFNTLAQNYINGFGYALPSEQTDLPYYATQLPHYGYQYGDYIMDSYT